MREDFISLELGSIDIILGMRWMQILENTKVNSGALTMEMMVEGRRMVIKGDTGLSKDMASLTTMVRAIQEGGGFFVELQSLEGIRGEEGVDMPHLV